MDKKYLVTQNNEATFFELFEDAVASMTFEDAELWEKDEFGCYIKIFLP
jgi:hypothetical protein